MKQLLISLLLCICGCSTLLAPRAGSRAHLDSIIVPHLELDNVAIRDAVDKLHSACAFHDPRRLQGKSHGFSFILKFEVSADPTDHPPDKSSDPFANLPPSVDYSFPNVSLCGTNQSMSALLNDLCDQTGMEFSIIRKGRILIQPKGSGQQLHRR